jgi:hypothetical protein
VECNRNSTRKISKENSVGDEIKCPSCENGYQTQQDMDNDVVCGDCQGYGYIDNDEEE